MISEPNPSRNYSYWAIASFFGFLAFMMQPTAYTWGEQDMMPFFQRVFDPNYLSNDFFTNTTITKNPRWIFGYLIVSLSWLTTLPWYKILYLLKLVFLILSPVLYFEVLVVLLRKYVDEKKVAHILPFVLLGLIAMVFLKEYRYYFSVASWLPFTPALHAYNISIALGFVGLLLKEYNRHPLSYLTFFFISCLVHPVIGLFTIGFYLICSVPQLNKERNELLAIGASGVAAVIVVKYLFATQQPLPASEFIEIYVKERHPWHYSVVDYFNRKGDWGIFFAGMNLLFMVPLVYGFYRKRREVWQIALAGLLAYVGSIGLQYVFIDIIPSKIIAYVGVSRFTTFGYWIMLLLWGLVLADLPKTTMTVAVPSMRSGIFVAVLTNFMLVGLVFLDNPFEHRYQNRKAYYDFVQSTAKDAIFATYSQPLNTDMRLVGQRGVFVGDEFPFAEQYIAEYGERRRLMYGSRHDERTGTAFYRNLKPADFIAISKKYQLDYIVIETRFKTQFQNQKPVWENHRHSVYRVENLRI